MYSGVHDPPLVEVLPLYLALMMLLMVDSVFGPTAP